MEARKHEEHKGAAPKLMHFLHSSTFQSCQKQSTVLQFLFFVKEFTTFLPTSFFGGIFYLC
jgi:hypothetical protein